MKKYISPEFKVVSLSTNDIMVMSGNDRDDGTTYTPNGIDMQDYFG